MDVTCPTCGAAMRLNPDQQSFECEFCGTFRQPRPNADGVRVGTESTLACPLCEVPLNEAEIGRQAVLYCRTCGGVLAGMGDFLPLIAALRAEREPSAALPRPIDPEALDRRVRCPKCRAWMHTHPYGGPGAIVIDNCASCAVNWLDRGEISRVAVAPDQSRWTPPLEY